MKSAFFVAVCGYALDIAPEDPNVLLWTITPKTFTELCREEKIRDSDLDAGKPPTAKGRRGREVYCVHSGFSGAFHLFWVLHALC